MSEEKVLTLRGKKAVWAPAPAGVGGNVQVVTIDGVGTGSSGLTYTCSHTGAEIAEMAKKGTVIADMLNNGVSGGIAILGGVFDGAATFILTAIYSGTASLSVVSVPKNSKTCTYGGIQ